MLKVSGKMQKSGAAYIRMSGNDSEYNPHRKVSVGCAAEACQAIRPEPLSGEEAEKHTGSYG